LLNFLSKVKGNREGVKNINFINLELVHCQVIINTIIANRCILYIIFVSVGALSHFIDPIAVARKKVITKVMSVVQFFRYLAVFYFPPTKRKIVTKMEKKNGRGKCLGWPCTGYSRGSTTVLSKVLIRSIHLIVTYVQ